MSGAVTWARVTFKPVGSCEQCAWTSNAWSASAAVQAKRHAKFYPGHTAITEAVTRGTYRLMTTDEAAS